LPSSTRSCMAKAQCWYFHTGSQGLSDSYWLLLALSRNCTVRK